MDSKDVGRIAERVTALKERYHQRDRDNHLLSALREGRWEDVAPGAFTEDYPAPMVANRIAVMAADVAASLAPLPSINCAAATTTKDAPKRFAEKRTKIANHYAQVSRLQAHQTDAGDNYNFYGMLVYFIEPDFDLKMPVIRTRSSKNAYAVWDGFGDTILAAEEWESSSLELCEQFDGLSGVLKAKYEDEKKMLKVVRYSDRQVTVLYLPDLGNHVLAWYAAPIPGRSQYVCIPRPSGTGQSFSGAPRGAYVDLIFPQMARHDMANLMLEAAYKAVQAPVVVPQDVTSVPYGPDAVIPTQNPQGVGRLRMDIPQASFQAMQWLDQDLAIGGMSPEARTGNIQASVITGKGIEAASAGYSAQIANAQLLMGFGIELAIERCFRMDEHLWPNLKKEIRGLDNGVPFSESYVPSKDIKGDHSVEVQYGFMLGMAPNNALVFLLQAQAGGLVSRDYVSRQLPIGINVSEEQRKVDVERLRTSMIDGLSQLSLALPQFVANGQDPSKIVRAYAEIITRIQKGEALEDVVSAVLAPEPPPPAPGAGPAGLPPAEAGAPGSDAGGGSPLSQMTPDGAPLGPGDRPDLAQFLAGVNANGEAQLGGQVSRMNPIVA
jgi:hypothetical protein